MNNPQENQQAQHYQNHWWEVELVRKEQRIVELEAALDVRDMKLSDISSACESAGCLYDEAMDEFIFKQKQRIAELERAIKSYVQVVDGIRTACGAAGCMIGIKYSEFISSQATRIAELEEQNLNMMALFRDFYELEFNRDECWEIIKKYGGDA